MGDSKISRRRLLLVTPDYPPDRIGGVGNHAEIIALQIRRAGWTVDVAAFTEASEGTCRTVEEERGRVFYLRRYSNARTNWAAWRYLRRHGGEYDLIHCLDNLIVAGGLFRGRGGRTPVIGSLNNLQAACPAPEEALRSSCERCGLSAPLGCLWRSNGLLGKLRAVGYVYPAFLLARRLARGCDHYIAVSEDTRRRYIKAGLSPERVTAIPRWLDDRYYGPANQERVPAAERGKRLRVLFVGQLGPRKGPQDLLEGYLRLPKRLQRRTELVILGRGPLEQPLRRRVEEAKVGDHVRIGYCPYEQLPQEYARAEIFVNPVRWPEPAGATRLEAMAHSLPILSSENPSAREIMGDDGALYYRAFDMDDLAEKLAQLLEDAELRQRLGSAAHARLARHATPRVVEQFLAVYEGCLQSRGA